MRETEASGWMVRTLPERLTRGLWLATVALSIGFVMAAGPVRAADGDDDDDNAADEYPPLPSVHSDILSNRPERRLRDSVWSPESAPRPRLGH